MNDGKEGSPTSSFDRLRRRDFLAVLAGSAVASCTSSPGSDGSDTLDSFGEDFWFDGLSFLPEDMNDIAQSGLSAMICDVSQVEEVRDPDGTPRYQRNFEVNDKALDQAIAKITASDQVFLATKGSQLLEGGVENGAAAFLQFQSCETIGDDLERIGYFHRKGLRILQLTHHNNNRFAGGAIEPEQSGMTDFGRDGLAEMNRVGILPDVAHGSVATINEAARRSTSPVVYSHGACRALLDHPRCINDEGIRAIAEKGGVVGIFMMSFWLTKDPEPNIGHLLAHIRHVIKVGGIEAVGISNDFPMSGQQNLRKLNNDNAAGVKEYLGWWRAMRELGIPGYEEDPAHVVIPELNNINRMATIKRALEDDGFSAKDVSRIVGLNFARVMTDALG